MEDMLKIVRKKYEKLKRYKKPFPDAVMIHSNSDTIKDEETANKYKITLQKIVNLLKAHANYILLVSPGLFSPDGEMENHWNDHMQESTLRCIEIQADICASDPTITCINFRTILQKKIKYFISKGFTAQNLKYMVGKKKLWVNETGLIEQTWDYQGSGGILTFDGEHLNERGTKLLVSVVAEQFNKWKGLWEEDSTGQDTSTPEKNDDSKDKNEESPKKMHKKKHSSYSKSAKPSFLATSLPTSADTSKIESKFPSIGETEQLNVLKALWSRDVITPEKSKGTKDDSKKWDKFEASWQGMKDDRLSMKKHKRKHSRHSKTPSPSATPTYLPIILTTDSASSVSENEYKDDSRHSKTLSPSTAPTYLPIIIDVTNPITTDSTSSLISESANREDSWHYKTSRPTAVVTYAPTNLDVKGHLTTDSGISKNKGKGLFSVLAEQFNKLTGLGDKVSLAETEHELSRDVMKLENLDDAKDDNIEWKKIEVNDTLDGKSSQKKHRRKHSRKSETPSPSAAPTYSLTNLDIEKFLNETTEELIIATTMKAYASEQKNQSSVASVNRNETFVEPASLSLEGPYINASTTAISAHIEIENITSVNVNVTNLQSISKETDLNLNSSLVSLAANNSSASITVFVASPNLQAINSTSTIQIYPVVDAQNISLVTTNNELPLSDRIGFNHTQGNTTQPISHLNNSIRFPAYHVGLAVVEASASEDAMLEIEEVFTNFTGVIFQHPLYSLSMLALVFMSVRLFRMWFRPSQQRAHHLILGSTRDDAHRHL